MQAEDIQKTFPRDFLAFMNEAVTAFHASEAAKLRLKAAGFTQLSERDAWALQPGGKYFFARNDTSVIAFTVGKAFAPQSGSYTVLGAHTDSPCLRVKPVACVQRNGNALLLNTQPYGGGLWHTWFDRDLGLAGRVVLSNACNGEIETKLFRIDSPVARIPTLAIHLTAGAEREGFAPNLHEHGKALLSMKKEFFDAQASEDEANTAKRIHPALLRMVAQAAGVEARFIEDVEMQLIDTQPATLGGAQDEFLFSGRLDNLCSSYQCLRALIDDSLSLCVEKEEESSVKMVFLFDHEEIGSNSPCGAASSLFMDTIQRIQENLGDASSSSLMRALRKSFVVSADMAHGLHPNYPAKHDASMAPVINGGLVVKHNANQRYATNALSATLFRKIGAAARVPVQEFAVRADSGCGSTIGPIIATLSGILTVDCGTPQFSMHSIREMMGTEDAWNGYQHLKAVFALAPSLGASLDSIKV